MGRKEISCVGDGMNFSQHLVFGLDIGTRSIIGTVGYRERETFQVVAQCIKEHETRAMLDGQIHDINKVGETICEVKQKLEEQIKRPLTEVCIAAAGRVLRTVTVKVDHLFGEETEVTSEHIYSLDLLGVEKAHDELAVQNNTDIKFFCVGYSVIRYYLNDYVIGKLENHKASKISAELIATFLPEEVVDGLYRAVQIADLEVANLTLEPIAAISVAIPNMYRMLNIALADVGAGTSDICITQDGSIVAYGMIPNAGDEITEVIARQCLVDFQTAEKIKVFGTTKRKTISYKDIMGIRHKITKEEVQSMTMPVILDITKQIAGKIKELNGGKSVSAVFVVGGGGKYNSFTENLAKELELSNERVALRGEEVLKEVNFLQQGIKKDPLLVTPIGICLNFYEQKNNFIFVQFNKERMKLYDNNRLTVADAAIQAGFPNDRLFPKRGKEIRFSVNGKPRMIRGAFGENAVITINGAFASISTEIVANDKINIVGSTEGEAPIVTVEQLAEYNHTICFEVQNKKIACPKFVQVNEQLVSGFYQIKERDEIQILSYYTVAQVLQFMDLTLSDNSIIYVNNKEANQEEKLYENFSLNWNEEVVEDAQTLQDKTSQEDANASREADSTAQEKQVEETHQPEHISQSTLPVSMKVTVNNKEVLLQGKSKYVFVDIFDLIDFDLKNPKGKEIVTLLNQKKANFTEPLHTADVIDIFWKD